MSMTSPTTPRSQPSDPVTYTPSPSTTPPSSQSSSVPTGVDATYQIVRIKPTNTDWLMPGPSDRVEIIGPVPRGDDAIFDDKEEEAAVAAEEREDDGFEIPCAAHLTLGGSKSIHLNCLYYSSSTALFADVGECADETVKMADEADRVSSVGITMQDAIFCAEEREDDEMVEGGEDVRDDNGNPFLVLHVNRGLAASARLYCKKIPNSHNILTDGFFESLGLDKGRRDRRWSGCCRTKKLQNDCT